MQIIFNFLQICNLESSELQSIPQITTKDTPADKTTKQTNQFAG